MLIVLDLWWHFVNQNRREFSRVIGFYSSCNFYEKEYYADPEAGQHPEKEKKMTSLEKFRRIGKKNLLLGFLWSSVVRSWIRLSVSEGVMNWNSRIPCNFLKDFCKIWLIPYFWYTHFHTSSLKYIVLMIQSNIVGNSNISANLIQLDSLNIFDALTFILHHSHPLFQQFIENHR